MPIKRNVSLMFAAGMAFCACASAQMVVHAISGKIKGINSASKTVDVIAAPDGTVAEFKLPSKEVPLDFNNDLRSESTDPGKFQKIGDFAVVYYYGFDTDRTAVGIKDLGADGFQKLSGTVAGFQKKDRVMAVKDSAGKTHSFTLSDHLIVDNGVGVQEGRKYEPHKGAQVRVTYLPSGDKNTAVFMSSTALGY